MNSSDLAEITVGVKRDGKEPQISPHLPFFHPKYLVSIQEDSSSKNLEDAVCCCPERPSRFIVERKHKKDRGPAKEFGRGKIAPQGRLLFGEMILDS